MRKSTSIFLFSVIFAFLAGAVFVSWPNDGFKLFVEDRIRNDEPRFNRLKDIVRTAISRTDRFAQHQSKLAFSVDPQKMSNPVPNERFGGALQFSELVALSIGVELDDGTFSFKGEFEADKILESLQARTAEWACNRPDDIIGILCARRYFLVVQSFSEPLGTSNQDPNNEPIGEQLLAFLYPQQKRPTELPYRGGANDETLADLLAYHLLNTMESKSHDCALNPCARQITSSLRSLDSTILGLDIFLRGLGHPDCSGMTEELCLMKSEAELMSALEVDPDNDHAHFGVGLIRLNRARNLDQGASAYEVGKEAISGFDHLKQATQDNDYLSALLSSEEWGKLLSDSEEFSGLGLSIELIQSADAYRKARQAMITGEYEKVLNYLDSIEKVPDWFSGHLAALRAHAKLLQAEDRSEAIEILREFEDDRKRIEISTWAAIYGPSAAQWANGDEVWIDRAAKALDEAVLNAHDEISILEARAVRAAGLCTMGQTEKAAADISHIEENVDKTDPNHRSILVSLGWVYSIKEDFEKAREVLAVAIEYDQKYLSLVRSQKRFEKFREVQPQSDYEKWIQRVSD